MTDIQKNDNKKGILQHWNFNATLKGLPYSANWRICRARLLALHILILIFFTENVFSIKRILVKELFNTSKFDSKSEPWKIENSFTEWIVEKLSSEGKYIVMREKLSKKNSSDIFKDVVLEGKITKFDTGSRRLGADILAEYVDYRAEVNIELELTYFINKTTKTYTIMGKGEKNIRKIRPFYPFLIPTAEDTGNEMVTDFEKRREVKWGSAEFNISVVGEACRESIEELTRQVDLLLD